MSTSEKSEKLRKLDFQKADKLDNNRAQEELKVKKRMFK